MSTSLPPAHSGKLQVCHVAVGDLWAGAEVQLKVLLSKLVQKPEFNLSVILFNGGRLRKEIEGLGIRVTVFPETEWGSAKIFLELMREIKKSNAQLVHTHKYKDTILAAPAAKLCGIPHVVRTVHGLREPFQGLQAFKMSLYETIERTVHRYCVDSIIGVSSQIECRYKAEGEVSRVICIRNGIDFEGMSVQTDRWRTRKDLGVDMGICLIGTVGRLTPVKGIPYLLQVASILLRQGANVKVLIVGDGSIRLDLMAQTHDLGISENVVFLGHREDADELVQALDIFVLPSLSEGFPMALLEAMAASRVVVASRVGGIPEIVEDGFEGFLVEPMDIRSFAERCRQLIQSPDFSRSIGEMGSKQVEHGFSSARMADCVSVPTTLGAQLVVAPLSRAVHRRFAHRLKPLRLCRGEHHRYWAKMAAVAVRQFLFAEAPHYLGQFESSASALRKPAQRGTAVTGWERNNGSSP